MPKEYKFYNGKLLYKVLVFNLFHLPVKKNNPQNRQ